MFTLWISPLPVVRQPSLLFDNLVTVKVDGLQVAQQWGGNHPGYYVGKSPGEEVLRVEMARRNS